MNILIVGIGYLGEALADNLAARGHRVAGLTFSPESAEALTRRKPYRVLPADVSDAAGLGAAVSDLAFNADAVVHCASSGRGKGVEGYRAVYSEGARNLLHALPGARLVFTSSTSVYAQEDGEDVDESSPAEPTCETGRLLRETEDLVLKAGGIVARLAGIYGPGRSVILCKFLKGESVIESRREDGEGRFLNQVHRDDIVSALRLLVTLPLAGIEPPRVFNVADSAPQSQRELYGWLGGHFRRPLPPVRPPDVNRKRGWTHKRIANGKLVSVTGWSPRYPSYQDAILHDPDLVSSIERQCRAGR